MINTYLASGDTVTQPIVQFIMTCIKNVSRLEDQALINYASSHSIIKEDFTGAAFQHQPKKRKNIFVQLQSMIMLRSSNGDCVVQDARCNGDTFF